MGAADRRRVEDLAERALDLDPAERRPWVEASCGDDLDLARQVMSLLGAVDESTGFLRVEAPAAQEVAPDRIGPFRLLELLGTGGMSSVHLAEQESPRRKVALKISSLGFASPSARRRFELEAEIVGGLSHPSIAQVYASGTETVGGREVPWLALEYVEGGRELLHYAEEAALDLRARLELVRGVCDAVQYSHGRGVIHRDLKPANLLVDRSGRPKLIDFGIARVADEHDLSRSFATQAGELLGTVRYMSPEQLGGRPEEVDGRTDVYALGVVLYELVCGEAPHELAGKSLTEIARTVAHDRPRRPRKLTPDVEVDLEWILLRAIEPDRERRYASAAELSAELRRFLAHEPILAGPPSRLHALALFARRNRALVSAAALLLAGLVAFTAYLVWSNRELERANETALENEQRADLEAARAELSAYAAGIGACELALRSGESDLARRTLEELDPSLRGWEWHYLRSRLAHEGRVLAEAGFDVWCVDVHPDGERVAFGGQGRTVHIVPIDGEGEGAVEIETPTFLVPALRFDAGGRLLAGTSQDGRVWLWDVETGALERTLEADRVIVHDLAFHPVDGRLATSGWDGRVRLWDVESGEEVGVLAGPQANILSIDFSPDGKHLATASTDRVVRVFDVASGELVHEKVASGSGLVRFGLTVRFDRRGRRVASSAPGGGLRTWNVGSGVLDRVVPLPYGRLMDCAFLPDGEHLAAVSAMGAVMLLRARDLRTLSTRWAHELTPIALATSRDGSRLVSAGRDGRVVAWDTAALLADFDSLGPDNTDQGAVAISADERWVATSMSGTIVVSDAESGRQRGASLACGDVVVGLAFDPSGDFLTAANGEGALRRFRLSDGERVRELEWPGGQGCAMATDAGSTWLVTVHAGGTFVVRDRETLESIAEHTLPPTPSALDTYLRPATDPTGERVAWPNADRVGLLSLPGLEPLAVPPVLPTRLTAVALHPDGRRIAAFGRDGQLYLLAVEEDEPLLTVAGPAGQVVDARFSPDGSRLAALTRGGSLHLFLTDSGLPLFTTSAHEGEARMVRFGPRGTYLVTTGAPVARIWDTR